MVGFELYPWHSTRRERLGIAKEMAAGGLP